MNWDKAIINLSVGDRDHMKETLGELLTWTNMRLEFPDLVDVHERLKFWTNRTNMQHIVGALEVAQLAHGDQKDKAGLPYWQHAYEVMIRIAAPSLKLKIAALLHDVLEDTEYEAPHLRQAGISDDVLKLVGILTRRKGEQYTDYLDRVAEYPEAIEIKLADLSHNLDLTRRFAISDSLVERYERAQHYLTEALHNWRPKKGAQNQKEG